MVSTMSFESRPSCCSTSACSRRGVLGKILVLGPKGCGKSSLVKRLLGQPFDAYIRPTLGSNLHSMPLFAQDMTECIELWDTAGDVHFRSVAPHYYHNVDLLVGIFDASRSRSSFAELCSWIDDFVEHHSKWIPIFIVSNKIDLVPSKAFAVNPFNSPYLKCEHFKTSALTKHGVQHLADRIKQAVGQLYLQKIEECDLMRSWVLLEANLEHEDEYYFTKTVRVDSQDKSFDYQQFLTSSLLSNISTFFLRICRFI